MTKLLCEHVIFEIAGTQYKIRISGSNVLQILERTDIIKKYLINNLDNLSLNELRLELLEKYKVRVELFSK